MLRYGTRASTPSKHFYNSSSKSYRVIFLTYNPAFYVRRLQTPRTIILQLVADLGLQSYRQNGSRLHHLSTHMENRETPSALDVTVRFFSKCLITKNARMSLLQMYTQNCGDMRWRIWRRQFATSRTVAGSISHGFTGRFFIDLIFLPALRSWGRPLKKRNEYQGSLVGGG